MANHQTELPIIVLVHGAFEDASIWNGVITRLWQAKYRVVAFGNPLNGVASDSAYLQSLLDQIDGPVILAAHSYGGAVITQAAAGRDQVRGLVYAGAIMPATGEAATDLLARFPGSSFSTSVQPVSVNLPDGRSDTYLLYQDDKFHSQVAADVPADVAAMMLATQRPMNMAALTEKITAAGWLQKPSWQIRALEDRAIPQAEYQFEAERAQANVIEVASSHAVTVSRPDIVADVIMQAARATMP